MISHEWVTSALCSCGAYLWTNPGAGSVVCSCHVGEIVSHVVVSGKAVTDEAAFQAAVAADLGVGVDEVTLIQAAGP